MYDTEYELGTPIPGRSCGNCTLCCKVNGVPELEKPVGEWCKHCEVGKGCKIYSDRPEVCAKWYCGWRTVPFLSDVWYPASARIVVNVIRKENHLLMVFCVDRGMRNRWKEPPWNERLLRLARVGMEKAVPIFLIHVDDGQRWIMLPNGPVKWAPHTVPLPMGENEEGIIWKLVSFPSHEAAHQAVEQWGGKPGSPRVRAVLQNWAMINSIQQGEMLER